MNEEFDRVTGEIVSREELARPVDRLDFQLNARESAEYVGERLGHLVSAGAFRQLVMEGEAPAPITGNDFKAVWSQAALAAWTGERIEAAAADSEAGEEDPAESEPQHENVYDFFEKTYSPYYELADARISALNREKPMTSWCDQWWLHKSVVGRMVAAWYAWEDAFAAGGGAMSSWILEHADRHYDRVMAEDGPFRKCKSGHTDDLDEYRTTPAPDGLRLLDEAIEEPDNEP